MLLNGEDGEAYNVSEDYDGLTLGEYAEFIASMGGVNVIFDIKGNPNASRAQNALLDNAKIKGIGFKPLYSVKAGLRRTYDILKSDKAVF